MAGMASRAAGLAALVACSELPMSMESTGAQYYLNVFNVRTASVTAQIHTHNDPPSLSLLVLLAGALAVHCKAGLGRTGVLICSYIMKHFK